MTKKTILLPLLVLLVWCAASAQAKRQKFFNLTADEVKIDSVLPFFSYSIPLDGQWRDSVYTVSIEYPEFLEMGDADVSRYNNITDKKLPAMPEVTVNVVVERKRGHLEASFVPLVMRDGKPMKLVSFMLDIKSSPLSAAKALTRTADSGSSADRYAAHSVLATGRWAKIRVSSTGVYEITDALVRSAGLSSVSSVKVYGYGGALQNEVLTAEDLIEYDDLKEVPTCTVNGRKLFRAQGPVSWSSNTATRRTRNPYSDYGYYFLTESDGEPLTVDSATFVSSFYPSADDYHTLHEVDNYAWYQGGRNLCQNDPISLGTTKSYQLDLVSGQGGAGTVAVCVTAGQSTSVQIAVNDSVVGTIMTGSFGTYDHGKDMYGTYRISNLLASNTVSITTMSGGPARLDYISVSHDTPRPSPVLSSTSFPSPEYVYNITNQDHHADPQADMVIIVPTSTRLTAQAQRLKQFHEEHDGLRVNIVPADELYNEFSSGTPDANAYRRYMKMLYDRTSSEEDMPSYLLLFGDCVWDNRLNTTECSSLDADDLLLCHESEDSFNDVNCYVDDGFFCYLDDGEGGDPFATDKLDVAVGRFPVRNEAEAKIMVDKTINYIENANAGSWQNKFVFMGDDGNDNQHMRDADQMAMLVENINPAFQVERIMWDAYKRESSSTGNSYPDATRLIKQRQAAGALVMNYSGHGGPTGLSHEYVLTYSDFASFTNTNLPLWITASCNTMPYDSQQDNLGEVTVLNENGGAVAFFGTTRTVYVDRNNAINRAYLRALLTPTDGKYVSIGEAQRQAKNQLVTSGGDTTVNKLQYALLGDPALVLNVPRSGAVIDSINGVAVASAAEYPQLAAGSRVSIKGHIETADGTKDTSYNGVVSALVRDAEKLIVCRLNNTSDEGADTPFTYYDRSTVLFNGNDSVRGGEFAFTFAVPKDIDYSNESGLINVLAVNAGTNDVVNGCNDDFVVGGTADLSDDEIGPSIYCYLNSPSFVNGGNVNTTPYFVAEITDKDGINTTGSSIGHDLVLTIDGNMSLTYVLNDNFEYDFGSYTSGRTYYNIPQLTPGKHTLTFTAWDIMNNSSTATLDFNVVEGLAPNVYNIDCSSNPATTGTTFIVTHDRAGSNLDVIIEVFDISGRPLWRHSESGVASSGTYTFDWDLTGDTGGKLDTGVYIYRVKIGDGSGGMVSKAKKLIIIN